MNYNLPMQTYEITMQPLGSSALALAMEGHHAPVDLPPTVIGAYNASQAVQLLARG